MQNLAKTVRENKMQKKKCTVNGCNEKHLALNFCNKHYLRFKRGNQVEKKSAYEMTIKERLLNFCIIDKKSECWNWISSKNEKGYGAISIKNKHCIAHRESYKIFIGKIPKKQLVCHRCDNPSCINPSHLFLGNDKINSDDKIKKGRLVSSPGSKNGNSKLNEKDVIKIKLKINKGYNLVALAKEFNVTPESIYYIKNNKTWRHVNV